MVFIIFCKTLKTNKKMTQMIYVIGFVVFVLIIGYFGAKKEAEVEKTYQERTKAESDACIAEAKQESEAENVAASESAEAKKVKEKQEN